MRLGLISDTHGRLRPAVLPVFDGVDAILHAGDVGGLSILDELGALAPVTAVWGNTDGFDVRAVLPEMATLEAEGLRIRVVHGHQLGSPRPASLRRAHPDADIIVFGHTHRALEDRSAPGLVLNPGAAGPARFNTVPSVAILTLGDGSPLVRLVEL